MSIPYPPATSYRLWPLWLLLGIWVVGSIGVHMVYIKRLRWWTDDQLAQLRVTDGPAWQAVLPGALFAHAGAEVTPVATPVLVRLATYLLRHADRGIRVTGLYTADEAKATVAPDLGKARAQAVRMTLQRLGVPDRQISINSERTQKLLFVNDSATALAILFVATPPVTARSLAEAQYFIDVFHPIELYFETGGTVPIRTVNTDRFALAAVAHLRIHRRAVLRLTGHTDSVGTTTRNLQLSYQRADAVRATIRRQGAPNWQIRTLAKGESSPIAPNATPEGRLANRRVTIVVAH